MKSDLLEISQKTLDCSPKGNSCILVHSDDLRQACGTRLNNSVWEEGPFIKKLPERSHVPSQNICGCSCTVDFVQHLLSEKPGHIESTSWEFLLLFLPHCSHTVGSFSCHRAGTGPLVCAANGDGVWFSLDTPPWARPLQADTARLHQTAQLLFAESPLWHQTGDRQAACLFLHQHVFANCSRIFVRHSLPVGSAYRKNCRWYSFLMVQPS